MKAEKLCSSSLTHLEVYRPIERKYVYFSVENTLIERRIDKWVKYVHSNFQETFFLWSKKKRNIALLCAVFLLNGLISSTFNLLFDYSFFFFLFELRTSTSFKLK